MQHKKPPRSPLTRELAVLYKRTFTEIIRNPTLLLMHCIMALVMGLLCGGIFYHISNDIAGAQNRLGEASRACLRAFIPELPEILVRRTVLHLNSSELVT